MLRAFGLMLLAWACMAGGARAQVVDVPKTYPIPLPPNANPEPQWELGMRYWWSEGKTRFDINSTRVNPRLGKSNLDAHLRRHRRELAGVRLRRAQ